MIPDRPFIRLALPKGRMYESVARLMADAGFSIRPDGRNYRPLCANPRFELKILKPQNIVRMVELGSHDLAFTGHDWVVELGADVEELLDTGLDPVRVVAAAPPDRADLSALRRRGRVVVASEYERLTRTWVEASGLDCLFVRSHGATEVFPPDDADLIVDNTATGQTLIENGLQELDTLLRSSTRLIANPRFLQEGRSAVVEELLLLLRSVLDARQRVMLEMNVAAERLEALLAVLPCMRRPTVSSLAHESGYAVKSAVPRGEVRRLIPVLRAAGATDILEYPFAKVVSG